MSILLAVVLILYGVASFMIANGVTKAEREEQEAHPSEFGMKFEEVEFLPRGGELRLRGWYMEPTSRGPTIILVHGLGGSRSSGDALRLASGLLERGYRDSELWIVSDIDHGDAYSALPEEYLDRVSDYFYGRFGAGQP